MAFCHLLTGCDCGRQRRYVIVYPMRRCLQSFQWRFIGLLSFVLWLQNSRKRKVFLKKNIQSAEMFGNSGRPNDGQSPAIHKTQSSRIVFLCESRNHNTCINHAFMHNIHFVLSYSVNMVSAHKWRTAARLVRGFDRRWYFACVLYWRMPFALLLLKCLFHIYLTFLRFGGTAIAFKKIEFCVVHLAIRSKMGTNDPHKKFNEKIPYIALSFFDTPTPHNHPLAAAWLFFFSLRWRDACEWLAAVAGILCARVRVKR